MGDFFDNLYSAISLLVWSDWLTLFILICFIVRGYAQGLAKELISLFFLIIAILLAWFFYEGLTDSILPSANDADIKPIYGLTFGAIVLGFWLTKKALYKLTETSSNIGNPCELNKFVSIALFLSILAVASWNYVDALANLESIRDIIDNAVARTWISFAVIYIAFFIAARVLLKLLNITVGTEQSCALKTLYEKILNILSGIDNLLNARNIVGVKNNIFGGCVGLLKGALAMLVIVLILQSFNWVSQQYYWIETQGTLRIIQDWSVDIKPYLSEHLLFVELEPGDEKIAEESLK